MRNFILYRGGIHALRQRAALRQEEPTEIDDSEDDNDSTALPLVVRA